ncbi:MAG: uracil-DNA glycosylase [Spirochaetaceae bacterium]|jgi:DNA polymerase|nr:uracil-DNA glycosylase [Spirochaetaceae bacterium]
MTGAEKTILANLLDLAGARLGSGYAVRKSYEFEDDCPCQDTALDSLESIACEVKACSSCKLCTTRKNAVAGEGVEHPLVLVIGEGPGADEDASGRPFVGKAGQLLDKMLGAVGLSRTKNCFIANIVKCRPPGNRDPEPDEINACITFLKRQITVLRPLAILCAGRISTSTLLETGEGISRLRGRWSRYMGIPLLPTFHPSYLLRDEAQKRPAWEDLKSLCKRISELDSAYERETAGLRTTHGI